MEKFPLQWRCHKKVAIKKIKKSTIRNTSERTASRVTDLRKNTSLRFVRLIEDLCCIIIKPAIKGGERVLDPSG